MKSEPSAKEMKLRKDVAHRYTLQVILGFFDDKKKFELSLVKKKYYNEMLAGLITKVRYMLTEEKRAS